MPKPNNDGGWILPAIIDPPRKCICIPVPDEPAHRQAFYGALLNLGYQHNWQRDPEHKALPVSVLWYSIVAEAIERFNSGGDYMCFSCEELQECIEPLLAAQTAAFQQMLNMSKYGTDAQPGIPMTGEQSGANLAAGTNPTCDLDITWSQALQVVQYADALILDALEIAESATNDTELAQNIGSITGLNELGIEALFGYIDLLLEGIAENYFAQYTMEYEEQAACAIFCLAKENCNITIDMIYGVFAQRVTSHFDDPLQAWLTITDMMAYLVDQDINGTIIADVLMLVVFGGGALAQTFLGDVGTKSLELVLKLAVNDANNDWVLLCECPEAWTYTLDSETLPEWVTFPPEGWGVITGETIEQTTDVVFSQDVTGIYFEIDFPIAQTITALVINQVAGTNIEGAGVVNQFFAYYNSSGGDITPLPNGLPQQNGAWEYEKVATVEGVKKIVVQYLFLGTTQTMEWNPVVISGIGANPFA